MTERFIIDDCGTLIDKETRNTYDYVSEVCPVLNKQEERIKELEESILNCLFNDVPIGEIATKLRLVDDGDVE